jgi:hypothetical protein
MVILAPVPELIVARSVNEGGVREVVERTPIVTCGVGFRR